MARNLRTITRINAHTVLNSILVPRDSMSIQLINAIGAIGVKLIIASIFLFMVIFSLSISWKERKDIPGTFWAVLLFWIFVLLMVMAILPVDVNSFLFSPTLK